MNPHVDDKRAVILIGHGSRAAGCDPGAEPCITPAVKAALEKADLFSGNILGSSGDLQPWR
jgi:hypothetical protein